MGKTIFGGLVPHPPIVVPAVGGPHINEVIKTREAMQAFAAHLAALQPELILMISPHAPASRDGVTIFTAPELFGDLGMFQAPEVAYTVANCPDTVTAIISAAEAEQIPVLPLDRLFSELDHGVLVPLSYLREAGIKAPMVIMGLGLRPYAELIRFGTVLRKVADETGKRVAIIASGDMSHRLIPGAPAGYSPRGKEFDAGVAEAFRQFNLEKLLVMGEDLIEAAGECGFRPLLMMMSALAESKVQPTALSYEGPFGVGYLVAYADVITKGAEENV